VFFLIVILSIIIIISISLFNTKTYDTFYEARQNKHKEYTVVGTIESKTINFDSLKMEYPFSFYIKDLNGEIMKVIYYGHIPKDFEKLEQIIIKGQVINNIFKANEIIYKCPSKYNDINTFNK